MKKADILRAIFLLEAYDAVSDMRREIKTAQNTEINDGPPVVELAVGNYDRDGGVNHGYGYLPIEFADQLIDHFEAIVVNELAKVGILVEGAEPKTDEGAGI